METVKTLARGFEVVSRLGVYAAGLLFDRLLGLGDTNVPARAAQIRDVLCALGPAYIKAGQVLASRPDIVRADYMEELATLQDDVPAFPDARAFAIIEAELGGRRLEEVYEAITPTPVAAASLGQVYRARLRGAGTDVAIKVQRPNIEPVIYRDLCARPPRARPARAARSRTLPPQVAAAQAVVPCERGVHPAARVQRDARHRRVWGEAAGGAGLHAGGAQHDRVWRQLRGRPDGENSGGVPPVFVGPRADDGVD